MSGVFWDCITAKSDILSLCIILYSTGLVQASIIVKSLSKLFHSHICINVSEENHPKWFLLNEILQSYVMFDNIKLRSVLVVIIPINGLRT